ncbi:hypothetical protein G4X40_21375 [Rhodococcus sp. D2-41]|nr:hypothetical protein [Rhodococcus sp. D2-41]MDG3012695.1 hypothetical protein [Rhodococcus sp. D2-41]
MSGRRAAAMVGIAAAVVVLGAGCGSSNNSSSPTTTAAATTTVPAGAPAAGADAATTKAVTDAYVAFFDGTTDAQKKMSLLENGQAFADTINAQADSAMAKGTTAAVSSVDVVAPGRATVVYTVSINGQPALKDQTGWATEVDGQWKVSQVTFCNLLTLEGNPPAVCQGASAPAPAPAPR